MEAKSQIMTSTNFFENFSEGSQSDEGGRINPSHAAARGGATCACVWPLKYRCEMRSILPNAKHYSAFRYRVGLEENNFG